MKGFIEIINTRRINEFDVLNHKGDYLGYISFNNKWKKFVFNPDSSTFYDSKCLEEISKELKKLLENEKK